MASQESFDQITAKFVSYFAATQPFLSSKIELADLRAYGRGRGVIAKADIAEDEDLFSVGRAGILSAENSTLGNHAVGQQVLSEIDDPWLALILVLIYERECSNSPWADYISTLKDTDLDTLMFWNEEDLSELQASAIRDKIGKTGADETFRTKIVPAVRSSVELFPSLSQASEDAILAAAHWAGSTIMAYAFDIEKQPSTQAQDEEGYVSDEDDQFLPKGMVPMADMLNADADRNNARLFYEADKVVMRTIKPVRAGEELFNDYGPLPRAELLRRYGYVTDNYARYDVVELPTQFVIDTVKAKLQPQHASLLTEDHLARIEEALEDKGYWEDGHVVSAWVDEEEADDEGAGVEDTLFPPGLQMLIYRLVAGPDRSQYAKRPEKIESDVRANMNHAYLAVLQARLDRYGTTVEQDRDLLLRQTDSRQQQQQQRRRAQAIQVRMGEKMLLRQAIAHVSAQLNDRDADEDARPAKRTKLSNGH